jgi:hypothetical protein
MGRPAKAGETVRIELDDNNVWALATAVADQLDSLGWTVTIAQPWADTFSLPAAPADNSLPTVWLKLSTEPAAPAGCRAITRLTAGGIAVNSHTTSAMALGYTAVLFACPHGSGTGTSSGTGTGTG